MAAVAAATAVEVGAAAGVFFEKKLVMGLGLGLGLSSMAIEASSSLYPIWESAQGKEGERGGHTDTQTGAR